MGEVLDLETLAKVLLGLCAVFLLVGIIYMVFF
ncbi:hypothetical protein CVD28_14845 [Bacillus sp. M6-12]|nr:hypothetical protein CVD28_14845 [Bacillus sp. M6-12]